MSNAAANTPKRLIRPFAPTWFMQRRTWTLFMLRELTCLFVGWTALLILKLVKSVAAGPAEYQAFLDWMKSPGIIGLNVLALAMVLYHTFTWFEAAPKAMRPNIGDERMPPSLIIAGHWGGWVVVTAAILYFFLGRG